MKLKFILTLLLGITFVAPVNAAEEQIELKTIKDKISYVAGTQYGNSLKNQGIEPDFDAFIQAVKDGFENNEPRFTPDQMKDIIKQFRSNKKETGKDKISYVAGIQYGKSLKRQGIEPNYDLFVQAVKDVFKNKESLFTPDQASKVIEEYQAERKEEEAKKLLGDKAWKVQLKKPEMMKFEKDKDYFWVLETNKGIIKLKLMPGRAPMHVTSTIFLTKKGFYDGLTFHRVIPGFMAQGGCPLGTGTGGPGYQYDGEFNRKDTHDKPYYLSMANSGPGTDGSQFFITFKAARHLDGKHTIFGRVVEGKEVVDKLEEAGSSSGETKEPLIINKARIEVT
ncbi:peptidylprolyl isomerase [Thermodesulfobacteriota bacterium]